MVYNQRQVTQKYVLFVRFVGGGEGGGARVFVMERPVVRGGYFATVDWVNGISI